ncbi:MAG: 50S ribosomal protein L25 [Gemmatimonadales bacterium]|nr:MAG: 50S ribosomal protein L25 [Gemmatimonadales bacterium]
MAQPVTITAERRAETGKGAARKLRMSGKVPAVIYGHGREPEPLWVWQKELERALSGIAAESTVIDLKIGDETVKTLIREIQRHPIRPGFLHVDFYEIHAGERIRLEVPVHLVGTPEGVRTAGGVLDQVLREIEIEVLPQHIPERVEVDVTHLGVGKSLHVRDITIPNATILTPGDETICTVVPPRVEEALPVAGVAAPEEMAEPEVIRKPRAEEEEEGAEEEAGEE